MRAQQIVFLIVMATAAGSCETAKNVVNCTALAIYPSEGGKAQPTDVVDVHAVAETEPVTNPCDAADDPAIWSDAGDPANTKIAITNKTGSLWLADRSEKIREMVCRYGARVPIREVWRARTTTATVRTVLGVSGILGTCGASNASNERRRS